MHCQRREGGVKSFTEPQESIAMSTLIRTSAIALAVAALAGSPAVSSASNADMKACYDAFKAEHLPAGTSVSFEQLPSLQPALPTLSAIRPRTRVIDLSAADAETGEVIAAATCRIRANGQMTLTPAERPDLLAAN